jgi:hypothetical protein
MRPADWATINNLAYICPAMPDGTEFCTSHSIFKAVNEKAIEYAKQVENPAKPLEKNTRCGCGPQVVVFKGLISQWDASNSLQNQTFDAIMLDLGFIKDVVDLYRGRICVL